jgi:hypothetical protein
MTEPSAGERSCGGGRSQFAIPIGSLDLERSNCIREVFANNNLNVTEGALRHLFLDGGSIELKEYKNRREYEASGVVSLLKIIISRT